ncbi:MAG: hypothetical protein ACI37Q_00370 [Candidatus Gastranaerophilaceae bacterium]
MKKCFLMLMLVFLGLPSISSEDDMWKKVSFDCFINPDTIIGVEDIYGFSFLLKTYNKGQYEPVNGNKIWYTIAQYTINCSNLTYKIGVIDSYGFENEFVNGDYNRYAKFQPIVPDTDVSIVASKLCRAR